MITLSGALLWYRLRSPVLLGPPHPGATVAGTRAECDSRPAPGAGCRSSSTVPVTSSAFDQQRCRGRNCRCSCAQTARKDRALFALVWTMEIASGSLGISIFELTLRNIATGVNGCRDDDRHAPAAGHVDASAPTQRLKQPICAAPPARRTILLNRLTVERARPRW